MQLFFFGETGLRWEAVLLGKLSFSTFAMVRAPCLFLFACFAGRWGGGPSKHDFGD